MGATFLTLGLTVCSAFAQDCTLEPGNVEVMPGEILKYPVCLDNHYDLVRGAQFDICGYIDTEPSDCMRCIDCELTERTTLFDCFVRELPNGCCRVIVLSKHPSFDHNKRLHFCDHRANSEVRYSRNSGFLTSRFTFGDTISMSAFSFSSS